MTLEALIAVAFAIALMILLGRLSGRVRERPLDEGYSEEWQTRDAAGDLHARAVECVGRIFSRQDQKYVREIKSPRLRGLFQRERKSLAHFWVDQTRTRIRAILREHVETARRSSELELGTEAKILLQYAELRTLCAMMDVCIVCTGPEWLRRAALYANEVSERLGEAQRSLAMTARSREMEGARSR
jgi:hypothetical protein